MQTDLSKAIQNLSSKGLSQRKIAQTLGISRSSVFNYLQKPNTQTTKATYQKVDREVIKKAVFVRSKKSVEKLVNKYYVKRKTFSDKWKTKKYLKGSREPKHPTILEKSRNILKNFWVKNFNRFRVMYFSADVKFTIIRLDADGQRETKSTKWELKSKTKDVELYETAFDSLIETFGKFFLSQNTNDESINLTNAFPKSISYMSLSDDVANYDEDIIDSKLELIQISLYLINITDIE